jgi:hypothetical protein
MTGVVVMATVVVVVGTPTVMAGNLSNYQERCKDLSRKVVPEEVEVGRFRRKPPNLSETRGKDYLLCCKSSVGGLVQKCRHGLVMG